MRKNDKWQPQEIIVHEKVADDPVTTHILKKCPDVPVKYTNNGRSDKVALASDILSGPLG